MADSAIKKAEMNDFSEVCVCEYEIKVFNLVDLLDWFNGVFYFLATRWSCCCMSCRHLLFHKRSQRSRAMQPDHQSGLRG